MRKEIHIHKQKLIYFFKLLFKHPSFVSTHNLKEIDDHNNGLKIVNALSVTYEPDRMV